MVARSPATRSHLAAGATDLRQRFDGRSDWGTQRCQADPLSGHLLLFVNRRRNRLSAPLPAHLERRAGIRPCAPQDCPCARCGAALAVIGYDTREQLVCEPAKFPVRVIKRAKRGSPCLPEPGVVTAPARRKLCPRASGPTNW